MRHRIVASLLLIVAATAGLNAQLAQRPAKDWIAMMEAPDRVAGLKLDYILSNLALRPGEVVADIGAGPGVISLPMAEKVGPTGKVYAVEVDQAFIDRIREKTAAAHVTNVTPVLGAFTDPKLPAHDVDLALFHDVLHHIADRAGYLKTMASYMKPRSRIAIIEMPPTGSHRNDPTLIVTKEQVNGWMADAGFKPAQQFDGLPDGKWFVVYERQ